MHYTPFTSLPAARIDKLVECSGSEFRDELVLVSGITVDPVRCFIPKEMYCGLSTVWRC